jgi:predicted amino acid racemase
MQDKLLQIQETLTKLSVQQDAQSATIAKTLEGLEKLREEQISQNKVLLRNTITVEEHHRRSLMLEKKMDLLESEVKPIKNHVQNVIGVGQAIKWIAAVATAITAAAAAIKVLSLFSGG